MMHGGGGSDMWKLKERRRGTRLDMVTGTWIGIKKSVK